MNQHEAEMLHLEALHTQARARRRSVEALVDRLAANLPPLETRSKKEAPSMTTTITTAQFRQYSPWYRAGKLGEETIFSAGHNPAEDIVLISAAEYQHHTAEVTAQDAKIEAYKREVMGLPAPEPALINGAEIGSAITDAIAEYMSTGPDTSKTLGELANETVEEDSK